MTKHVLIGCPIYERGWILPTWLDHIEKALAKCDQWGASFVFAYTPSGDDTQELLEGMRRPKTILFHREGSHSIERNWGRAKLETMVDMRNRLLDYAADIQPDVYLSLDSDVLVEKRLHELLDWSLEHPASAVAPLVYLGIGTTTNAFRGRVGRVKARLKPDLTFQEVSVICAAKAMGADLIRDPLVRYEFNSLGEDFGWSEAVRRNGHQLYWEPSIRFKHVMDREKLGRVDPRLGW